MVLLGVLPLEADPRRPVHTRGLAGGKAPTVRASISPWLEQRHELVMTDVARGSEDDLVPPIRTVVVAGKRPPRHARDHVRAADHRPAEGVRAEHGLRRDVVDEIVRRVLDHRDLLKDYLALRVDIDESGPVDHVRHHVERSLEAKIGDPRVDDGRLTRRRSVQLTAELVEDLRDALRRVARRALEQ